MLLKGLIYQPIALSMSERALSGWHEFLFVRCERDRADLTVTFASTITVYA